MPVEAGIMETIGPGPLSDPPTLNPPPLFYDAPLGAATVSGGDDRYAPGQVANTAYRFVAHLYRTGPSVTGPPWCTGFFVNEDTVVTAAHCLANSGSRFAAGGRVDGIQVIPGRQAATDKAPPFGVHRAWQAEIAEGWAGRGEDIRGCDIGVVRLPPGWHQETSWAGLSGPAFANRRPGFVFGSYPDSQMQSFTLYVTGYPDEWSKVVNGVRYFAPKGTLVEHHGRGTIDAGNPRVLVYRDIDTSGGQSGGPIYAMHQDGYPVVIGVHARPFGTTNGGVRLTPELFYMVRSWANGYSHNDDGGPCGKSTGWSLGDPSSRPPSSEPVMKPVRPPTQRRDRCAQHPWYSYWFCRFFG